MKTEKQTTALAKWDEQMAQEAKIAVGMEDSDGMSGGQFFSTKGGILSFQGAPIPNNQMAVIILDSILENVYYLGEFNAANPVPPLCYAFGREGSAMKPHEVVVKAGNAQNPTCQDCQWNAWNSSPKGGKGKACKNTRRLAMISAGNIVDGKFKLFDIEDFASTTLGFLRLAVTSVKGFKGYIKQLAEQHIAPYGVITKVKLEHDDDNLQATIFTSLVTIPNEIRGTIMQRHQSTMAMIDFPYPVFEDSPQPAASRGKAGRGKQAKKKYKY
jgi:hypothetical protein